jgi:asparagine synthetase B (glutamine-hydrolysing)
VRFPQLERVQVPPRPDECEFCDRDDFPTDRALKQHQDVMHGDRRQQQALGEAIVSGLHQTGVVGSGGLDAAAIAAAVAATLQTLGYGTRTTPGPDPVPDDDDEPAPEPAPEPAAKRVLSERQLAHNERQRAEAAARRAHAVTD